ncbi:hypothetical protein UT300019_17970 [Clostridium sp. CTA-19]
MDIYKVLKKQKKSYKRFVLFMGFIFILLPAVLIYSKMLSAFFIGYLIILEILIFQLILIRYNEEHLHFKQVNKKIVIEVGVLRRKYTISTDKVAIIHTVKSVKSFEILIITKSRFRNKRLKHVDFRFLDKQKTISKYYNRVKLESDDPYFYFVIRKGGVKKYLLLDFLYRTCVGAAFTDEAIEKIKEYRS